jgi:ABC-2 type transport system ATP-binding protein
MIDELVVEVNNLSKSYGGFVALSGVSFEVKRGEVFGILGRNGAGKTTLVEILEGLRLPDRGRVSVLGFDPCKNVNSIKQRVGVQLQKPSFYGKLKVGEIIKQFRSYYAKKANVEDLLSRMALSERADSYIKDLSGGQLQRLALTLALVNDPEIVFLDEPTTGLDPAMRKRLWHTVSQIKQDGKSVLLITHYIEEAEALCDRVCIMDAGRIIAVDSPANLISRVRSRGAKISLTTSAPLDLDLLKGIKTIETSINGQSRYVLESGNTGAAVVEIVRFIESQNNELIDMQITRACLEDAFVELTGGGM